MAAAESTRASPQRSCRGPVEQKELPLGASRMGSVQWRGALQSYGAMLQLFSEKRDTRLHTGDEMSVCGLIQFGPNDGLHLLL